MLQVYSPLKCNFDNKLNSFRGSIWGFCWRVPIFPTHFVIAVETLSDTTDNFLKILRIFLDPQLYESSENCLKLLRTVWHFPQLFKSSENCLKLPRTVWDFRELFESFENCLKILRTVWIFRELFETSENCLKIPRTIQNFRDCLRLPRTVWEFQELSKNFLKLFDRFWEHFTRNHGRKLKIPRTV